MKLSFFYNISQYFQTTSKRLILLYSFICVLIGAAPAMAANAVEGMYISSIQGAGEAVTSFKVTRSGRVFGIYVFDDKNGKKAQGTLRKCRLRGRVLRCQWRDKYGKGDWRVTFSRNYKRFNGKRYKKIGDYKRLGRNGGYKWSGEQIFQN